jgi:PEP-CTERM motif
MTRFLSHLPRLVTVSLALIALTMLAASPSVAQLRYATGSMVDRWNVYEPPFPNTLTQNVTTANGLICGPAQPCVGNVYPFVGGQNVRPVRPTGAIVSAGLGNGDPVNFPYASEWTQSTTGMIPSGVIPGVLSIWTIYDGRNAVAVPATGKGLASGGGPGNMVFAPLAAGLASDPAHQTLTFPGAFDPGMTTTSGNFVTTLLPVFPTVGANELAAIYTAGPNQFGGTAAILTDTPNRLTIDIGAPSAYQRTNGKCRAGLPFGDCQVGFAYGTSRRATSVRRHVNTAVGTLAPVLAQPGYWEGRPWTTGTITARAIFTGGWNSHAQSGGDTPTASGARNLVLVSPVLNYDYGLAGDLGGSSHIAAWDMTIQTPEPTAVMGLVAGLGLLGGLSWRSRRQS